MANILVRNVPESLVNALKKRARENRRSLQQEVLSILEGAYIESETRSPAEIAAAVRSWLSSRGRTFSDSTELIREDRER